MSEEPTIKTEIREENEETLINPAQLSRSSDPLNPLSHGSSGTNDSTTSASFKSPAPLTTSVHDAVTGEQSTSEARNMDETVVNHMVEPTVPTDPTVAVKTEPTPDETSSSEDSTATGTLPMRSINSNYCQTPAYTGENLPDNFFDELSHVADEIIASDIKSEPAGDELDNITTPCQSPQRPHDETETNLESAGHEAPPNTGHEAPPNTINEQVAVKSEVVAGEAMDEGEMIPDNFFEDLLDDRIAARVAEMNSTSKELKYADELRERLRKLDEEKAAQEEEPENDDRHKQKKSKKKSHKRPKDKHKKDDSRESGEHKHKRRKRSRSPQKDNDEDDIRNVLESVRDIIDRPSTSTGSNPFTATRPTTSHFENNRDVDEDYFSVPLPMLVKSEAAIDDDEVECLPVEYPNSNNNINAYSGFKKIKLEKCPQKSNDPPKDQLLLTPVMKRQKALNAAAEAIKQFRVQPESSPLSSFHFVSTVRKLPTSNSYVTQHIYDNRSPLHTINNVQYAFNSHSTRFNVHEWGLEKLPKIAANVAKTVGYDADKLFAKLQLNKLTNKFKKIKREHNDANVETIDETKSSFFTNAMTQTDDAYFSSARRRNAHDIGVQVTSSCGTIATQTLPVASNDDLPLMQLINVLNENQLLALTDFAELIREPASSAIDIYRLRQRMQEIYKCSQLPSALQAPEPANAFAPNPQINSMEHSPYNSYKARDPRAAYRHETKTEVSNPAYNYPTAAVPNPSYNYPTAAVPNPEYNYPNNGFSSGGTHHGVQPYHNTPSSYHVPPAFAQPPAANHSPRGYGRGRKH